MGAIDIAKDAIRIANTAGLSKDVIDLLQAKVTLLTDEIVSLTEKNRVLLEEKAVLLEKVSLLESEKRHIEKELEDLKSQKKKASPVPEGFDDTTHKVLSLFLHMNSDLSAQDIAQNLNLQDYMTEYHCDLLRREDFIIQTRIGIETLNGYTPPTCGITAKGRAYAIKNNL